MWRWQPMASMETIAPSITNMPRSAGIATISLDFSATLTCPSTRRWRAAKAETMWIGALAPLFLIGAAHRLAINRNHLSRGSGQRGYPRDEASLEFVGVER